MQPGSCHCIPGCCVPSMLADSSSSMQDELVGNQWAELQADLVFSCFKVKTNNMKVDF
jgi:hypothetical protein